jgi:hypothetical protein
VGTAITIVVFTLVVVSGLVAIGVLLNGKAFDQIGAGGMDLRPPAGSGGSGGAEESAALREDDIRQMLEARNRRRVARGEQAADVDTELRQLLDDRPARSHDAETVAEARAVVDARNARRRRRGEPEGDVEREVAELLERLDP